MNGGFASIFCRHTAVSVCVIKAIRVNSCVAVEEVLSILPVQCGGGGLWLCPHEHHRNLGGGRDDMIISIIIINIIIIIIINIIITIINTIVQLPISRDSGMRAETGDGLLFMF